MAVGLPSKTSLDADIFWTVFKSITIHGSYVGNRQDAIECVNIAASGAVKVHYAQKHIDELDECASIFVFLHYIFLRNLYRVYTALAEGKIAGRVVLSLD
jgi:propanol-preferring alcohol dehydrogenase